MSNDLRDHILEGTDKDTTHSYIDVYQRLFSPIKDTVRSVLEIGVQTGQSIMLWKSYFENAVVYGLDVSPIPPILNKIKDIICIRENAYDINFINSKFTRGTFDILIDDGPHTLESMLFFAKHYTPLLSEKGILIIEDVQNISWVPQIINAFPEEYRNKIIVEDRRHVKGRYDDILIILDNSAL